MKDVLVSSLFSLLAVSAHSQAQFVEHQKLIASDAEPADYFGKSVAVSGNYAIVGSWLSDAGGNSSGAAYIFRRDDRGTPDNRADDIWFEQAKIGAHDARRGDQFGYSVAIDGDLAVVGAWKAPVSTPGDGRAYVFRRDDNTTPDDPTDDTWLPFGDLVGTSGWGADNFGAAVAIDGQRIVVGAHNARNRKGYAYVFVLDENGTPTNSADDVWIEQQQIRASQSGNFDRFGWAVAIDGDHIVIGAPGDQTYGGSAYVYVRDDQATPSDPLDDVWVEQAFLTSSEPSESVWFGASVAVTNGDWVAIGGPFRYIDRSGHAGAAIVFGRSDNGTPEDPFDDSWTEVAALAGTDDHRARPSGWSVSLDDNTLAVGANLADGPSAINCGAAYIFRWTGTAWLQEAKITASDAAFGDGFGRSVSVSDGTLLVGAWADDDAGLASGAAYVLDLGLA